VGDREREREGVTILPYKQENVLTLFLVDATTLPEGSQ
jgi:hypothetical protein